MKKRLHLQTCNSACTRYTRQLLTVHKTKSQHHCKWVKSGAQGSALVKYRRDAKYIEALCVANVIAFPQRPPPLEQTTGQNRRHVHLCLHPPLPPRSFQVIVLLRVPMFTFYKRQFFPATRDLSRTCAFLYLQKTQRLCVIILSLQYQSRMVCPFLYFFV